MTNTATFLPAILAIRSGNLGVRNGSRHGFGRRGAGIEVETLSSCLAGAQVETLLRVVLDLRLEHRRATATIEDLLRTVHPNLQPEQMSTVAFVAHAIRKSEGVLAEAMEEIENLLGYPPEWIRPDLTAGL